MKKMKRKPKMAKGKRMSKGAIAGVKGKPPGMIDPSMSTAPRLAAAKSGKGKKGYRQRMDAMTDL